MPAPRQPRSLFGAALESLSQNGVKTTLSAYSKAGSTTNFPDGRGGLDLSRGKLQETNVSGSLPTTARGEGSVCEAESTCAPGTPPLGTPGASLNITAAPVLSKDQRRQSKVSFIEKFDLQEAEPGEESKDMDQLLSWIELTEEEAKVETEATIKASSEGVATFTMMDDSDEEIDSDDDNDEYDFDEEQIAQLLQEGADQRTMTDAIENAMAAAFERKLHAKTTKAVSDDIISNDNPYSLELDGRMTPGRMTPEEQGNGVAPDALQARVQQAAALAQSRQRRSSVARKSGAAADVISQAMNAAILTRRQSLAAKIGTAVDAGNPADAVSQAMEVAKGRHRRSIARAADVLDVAGFSDESGAGHEEVVSKLSMVQQAMEDARKRHRMSISRAMHVLDDAPESSVATNVSPADSHPTQCVDAAYGQVDSWASPLADDSWSAPLAGAWSSPMADSMTTPAQRVHQAVTNAYYYHCYDQYGYGCDSQWVPDCNGQQGGMDAYYGTDVYYHGQDQFCANASSANQICSQGHAPWVGSACDSTYDGVAAQGYADAYGNGANYDGAAADANSGYSVGHSCDNGDGAYACVQSSGYWPSSGAGVSAAGSSDSTWNVGIAQQLVQQATYH